MATNGQGRLIETIDANGSRRPRRGESGLPRALGRLVLCLPVDFVLSVANPFASRQLRQICCFFSEAHRHVLRRQSGHKRAMAAPPPPHSRPIALLKPGLSTNEPAMSDRSQTIAKVLELIEPYNKKGIAVTEGTR